MPSLQWERGLRRQGFLWIAGVDEAGRGPLAGPVVAAAVLLPPHLDDGSPEAQWLRLVDDSKALSAYQRERALEEVLRHAVAVGTGVVDPHEIDRVGIVQATCQAVLAALRALPFQPDYLLADYMKLNGCPVPYTPLVDGDSLCFSIAAASIVAKVTRDRIMVELDRQYPGYGLAQHKGYPTPEHLAALARLGPSPIHRTSFAPVAALLSSNGAGGL